MHKKRHDKILKKQKEVKKQTENCEVAISSQPEIVVPGNLQTFYGKKTCLNVLDPLLGYWKIF